MKALFATFLIASTLMATAPKAKAAETVGIIVGGMVSTMVLVIIPLTVHGGAFKAEIYQEAVDTLASGDLSNISQELSDMIEEVKKENAGADLSDLMILDAVINGQKL